MGCTSKHFTWHQLASADQIHGRRECASPHHTTTRPRHVPRLDAILLIVPIIWPDSEQYEQWMGLRKKTTGNYGFLMVLFFYCHAWQHKDPFAAAEWKKNVFLLAFLGVSWFSCKFSHHPRLPRLPRLPFWGLRNSERHSASGFLWNYGSI